MKTYASILFCLFLFCLSASPSMAASGKAVPGEDNRILKSVAFSDMSELHIIGADVDNDENLRWAVWSQTSAQGMVVKLALIKKTAGKPIVLGTVSHKDAFEPDIKRVVQWRYGKHAILAFTYHTGAAAQQVELYGLDEKNQPVLLDQRLGEVIGWSIGSQGQTMLCVYAKPESRLEPTCYLWDEKSHTLIRDQGGQP